MKKLSKMNSGHKLKNIRHPFLKGMPQKCQNVLFQGAEVIDLSAGYFVFQDGGKAEQFFLILKGRVDILTQEQDVRFDLESSLGVLQTLGPGEIVGWSWIIPPYHWKFNARVKEDARFLVVDGKNLRQRMTKDYTLAYEIYKRLVPVMNARLLASRIKLALYGSKPFSSEEGG